MPHRIQYAGEQKYTQDNGSGQEGGSTCAFAAGRRWPFVGSFRLVAPIADKLMVEGAAIVAGVHMRGDNRRFLDIQLPLQHFADQYAISRHISFAVPFRRGLGYGIRPGSYNQIQVESSALLSRDNQTAIRNCSSTALQFSQARKCYLVSWVSASINSPSRQALSRERASSQRMKTSAIYITRLWQFGSG